MGNKQMKGFLLAAMGAGVLLGVGRGGEPAKVIKHVTVYSQAGRYGGFSGPEGFARASQAVKFILNELGISWR